MRASSLSAVCGREARGGLASARERHSRDHRPVEVGLRKGPGRPGGRAQVPAPGRGLRQRLNARDESSDGEEGQDSPSLERSLQSARESLEAGVSPGAGLETADEQAEAAFADLILTSLDQGDESTQDLDALSRGGEMPEEATSRKGGFFKDIGELFGALAGGAHIVKKEDGRI